MNLSPQGVAKALGGEARGCNVLAPGPGHSPRDRSLSILVDPQAPDGFVVMSFAGDDIIPCRDFVRERLGMGSWRPGMNRERLETPRHHVPPTDYSEKITLALSIWRSAEPIKETWAAKYLSARGIANTDNPSLRYSPQLCAMVAALASPGGKVMAVQTTLLEPTALRKRDCPVPRKTQGHMGAGAVRLAAAGEVLGIAEGVETALSAMQLSGLPVWACLGAARMHQVAIPETVRMLIVFADNDEPGMTAARRTASQHRNITVDIRKAPNSCKDWNDALARREVAA
ncbi:MAG: toprim domain-containing protein [Rhizomicrobium sp.]|nr:toprim domain-containing protein [Rhizomicrobium sp.]